MIALLARLSSEQIERVRAQTAREVLCFDNVNDAGEAISRAEIIYTGANISHENIERAEKLKMLYLTSAGVENLPFESLSRRAVRVSNSGGIHGTQMAEQIMGVVIMFDRGLHLCVYARTQRKWVKSGMSIGELAGKTMLVVGAGKIGQVLASRAAAFGMRVEGVRRSGEALEGFDAVYGPDALHSRLACAHFVVALMPYTPETRGMFDSAAFGAMRPDAYFINYARGPVADEDALIDALRTKKIAGAGLDVFNIEPLPEDSPLWDMDNVIITPHTAGVSPQYTERAVDTFIKCVRAFDAGETMPTEVYPDRRY